MTVGDRIKSAREVKGWTQPGLAELCGWGHNQGRISHYETGKRKPTPDDMAVMEDALELHRGALMGAIQVDNITQTQTVGEVTVTDGGKRGEARALLAELSAQDEVELIRYISEQISTEGAATCAALFAARVQRDLAKS